MFDIHIIGMLKCDAEVGMTELDFFMSTYLTRNPNHNKVLNFVSITFNSLIHSLMRHFYFLYFNYLQSRKYRSQIFGDGNPRTSLFLVYSWKTLTLSR